MRITQATKTKKTVILLAVASMFWGIGAVGQNKLHYSEQLQFSAEDENVRQPVRIPDDAWSMLKKDANVLEVLTNQKLPVDQLPTPWFTASEVHLGGPNERDLVVIGKGPLQGANVTTFWVFLHTPHGLKLVLTVPAHDLAIKPARWNGFKSIEIASATAVQVSRASYRFDGKQYRVYEQSTQPIR
jgi:hypothetical protein